MQAKGTNKNTSGYVETEIFSILRGSFV